VNTAQLEEAIINLRPIFSLDRTDYRAKTKALETEWSRWLGDTYATDMVPDTRAIIFARAWDDAHSEGYAAVEWKYDDLTDFLRSVRQP